MPSFSDALSATETRKGPMCYVCRLLDDLGPTEDRDAIAAAIASDRMQSHVARALAAFTGEKAWASRGGTIARHRAYHLDR